MFIINTILINNLRSKTMNFNNKFAKIIGVSEDGIKNLEYITNYKNNN